MRLSALIDPGARGLLTENENVVGEITLGGSLGLVLFIGVVGGIALGVVWVLVREWLPSQLWLRAPLAAVLAVLTGGFFVISSENRDFEILEPASANVALFALTIGLAGAATVVLDRAVTPWLPATRRAAVLYGGLALIAVLPLSPLLISAYFTNEVCEDCSGVDNPPVLVGAFLALSGLATLVNWGARLTSRKFAAGPRAFGIVGVSGAALFGALHLLREIDAII
jgi:hypothetical protein